ncbi:MAG TPA: hypothetical protein VJI32_07165 [Candidatus Nanoarchaeia archaeon]|nr:hypothetical protein [Candidatus Nanoarchaeia archaeon]
MKLKKNNTVNIFSQKKGMSAMEMLGSMVLVLLAVVVFIVIFFPDLFEFGDIFKQEQDRLTTDPDGDDIRSILDKCPCTAGEVESKGCPKDFTEAQIQADKNKYNTDTGCGILTPDEAPAGTTSPVGTDTSTQGVDAPVSPPGAPFQHYRSLEIFGNDDGGASPENIPIRQACAGMVGRECPSEDNDCDTDEFSYEVLSSGCWVMASEDDTTDANDCGQAKIDDGTIISLQNYNSLNVDITNNYVSLDNEPDPANLFQWKWKSTSAHGSLLCKEGLWYGCKENSEGRSLPANGINHVCQGSEWVRE